MKKRWPLIVIAVLVGLQFVPKRELPPPVDPSLDFFAVVTDAPAEIESLTKGACYDCHSHTQNFPWYDDVQPVSWWIRGHVKGAQSKLNFATWAQQDPAERKLDIAQAAEELSDGHMPPGSYSNMHDLADLDERERKLLAAYFKSLSVSGTAER